MARQIFTAPQELLDQLKEQAVKEYSNSSEIIRRALLLYFQQQGVK